MRALIQALLVLAVVGASSQAQAHVMAANKGTLSIKEHNAYAVMSIPVTALTGFDDNNDQLIDAAELGRHSANLRTQIDARLRIEADGATPVEGVTFVMSPLTGEDAPAPIDYLVIMSAQRFEKKPEIFSVWTDLFGSAEKDQRIALTASRGETEELGVLTPERQQHRFFRGDLAVFMDFIGTGFTHILFGYDHLLFLLTIIVAAMSARQWLVILSGFTIAHSITLTAASLGFVSVSPQIVEPLIAASIVALALDNLLGGTRRPFALRAGIVFACGLLHGLGFAGSLADFGLSAHNIATSLVGFNLGVEFGQIVFVGAVLGVIWIFARLNVPMTRERLVTAVSICAVLPGAALLVERVIPVI